AATALLARPDAEAATPNAEALSSEITALRSVLLLEQERISESWDAACRALEGLPVTHAFPRGVAAASLALVAPALGESAKAAAQIQDSLCASAGTSPHSDPRLRLALAFHHLANGDLPRLKETAELLCEEATALNLELTAAWSHYLLGRVHYERNELATAEAHFAAVQAARGNCYPLLLRNAMHGLALVQQAQGHSDAAAQTAEALRAWVAQGPDSTQLATERAFAARMALWRGDLPVAEHWLRAAELPRRVELVMTLEVPRATRVRALLAQGTDAAARQAAAEVGDLLALYEARQDSLRVVELLALQALAQHAFGTSAAALDTLERALRLAEPA